MLDKEKTKRFVLDADLNKILWRLSLPAIAAMVLFGLNAFMDTVFIGQLIDSTALAGVALAYPLTSIMMGFGSWAGTGAGNLLSIAIGENDDGIQEKILGNSTIFMIISTLFFAIPSWIFAEDLIAMMGGRGEILAYGTEYLKISMLGAPLWVYGLGLNFIVRAEGKMKEAAIMMSYGLIVNLILTPIFIHYLDMGVAGAAWATNLGMLVYCLVGYWYFKTGKASFQGSIDSLDYDRFVFGTIVKLGFPGFIISIMGLVQAFVVFNAIVGVGTDDDLAFYAAANRITLFLITPLFGLMRALQPVVGINYGAAQYDRVKAAFILFCKIGFYIIAPFWILMTIFPDASLRLVLPGMEFSALDIWHFRIYIFVLPILPFVFMSLTYLPAIERPKSASIIAMARQLVFYVPVMLILPKWIGMSGVYYGTTAIDIIVTFWFVVVVWQSFKDFDKSVSNKEAPEKPLSI